MVMDILFQVLGYIWALVMLGIAAVAMFYALTILRAAFTVLNDRNGGLVTLQKSGFDVPALFRGKLPNESVLPVSIVGHGISGEVLGASKVRYNQLETIPGRGA